MGDPVLPSNVYGELKVEFRLEVFAGASDGRAGLQVFLAPRLGLTRQLEHRVPERQLLRANFHPKLDVNAASPFEDTHGKRLCPCQNTGVTLHWGTDSVALGRAPQRRYHEVDEHISITVQKAFGATHEAEDDQQELQRAMCHTGGDEWHFGVVLLEFGAVVTDAG